MNDRFTAAMVAAPGAADVADRIGRAAVYRWLAGLFAEPPTAAAIAAWRRGDVDWTDPDVEAPQSVALIRTAIAGDDDPAEAARRLGIAFGRLFLGLGGPRTVSPYESVHRHGRLAAEPAGAMAALLAARGLAVAHDFPDHLSVELTLLADLIEAGDPDETAMVGRLAGWVPAFADRCGREDPTGLWAGAAALLAALLTADPSAQTTQS